MRKVSDLYKFVWTTRPLLKHIESAVERTLEGTGLTVRTRAVLEVVAMSGPSTVPTIARALEIERQYVQVMVNEATDTGLTEAIQNPTHKRSPLFTLTAKGEECLGRTIDLERKNLEEIAAQIAPDDMRAALHVQSIVLEHFRTLSASHQPIKGSSQSQEN